MAGLRGTAHAEARWMQRAPWPLRTPGGWRHALATAHPAGPLPDGSEDWRACGMRLVAREGRVVTVMPPGWPVDGARWGAAGSAEPTGGQADRPCGGEGFGLAANRRKES